MEQLYVFYGQPIIIMRTIPLTVMIADEARITEFVVADSSSTYNVIFETPWIQSMKDGPFELSSMPKDIYFNGGKNPVRDQKIYQSCYMACHKVTIKSKEVNAILMDIKEEVLTMKDPPIRDKVDLVCIDELKPE